MSFGARNVGADGGNFRIFVQGSRRRRSKKQQKIRTKAHAHRKKTTCQFCCSEKNTTIDCLKLQSVEESVNCVKRK